MNAPPNEGIHVAATAKARTKAPEPSSTRLRRQRPKEEAPASPDPTQTAAHLSERPAANDSVPAPSAVRNMLTSALEALMSGGLTDAPGVPAARVLLELAEVESAWVSVPRDVRQREKALARLREAQKSAERVAAAVSRLRNR